MSELELPSIATMPPQAHRRAQAPAALLAIGAGLGIANVYYNQPILDLVADSFGVSAETAGLLPTLTQGAYGAGLLLSAPLGDLIDRRRLIVGKALLMSVALALSAIAPTLETLALAGLAIGLLGSVGQDFVPLAIGLTPEARQGRAVGTVMTGFLAGILCSRALGGALADLVGWRAVYVIASLLMAATAVAVRLLIPAMPGGARGSYRRFLRSLFELAGRHAPLRKAMATQALLALSLGAFWSTLAVTLAGPPFRLGAGLSGAFGLAGAAGALAASLFGRSSDRRGPMLGIRIGGLSVMAAFGGLLLEPDSLWVLVAGTALFDFGVMAAMVSHQSIVARLDRAAQARLNALLVTGAMAGMAAGSWLGFAALAHFGWRGVCAVGLLAGAAGLARSFFR